MKKGGVVGDGVGTIEGCFTHRVSRARKNWTETPTKRKNESPERDFEKTLIDIAPLYGCLYIKIPDFINAPINKIIAHKRPFDAVIITPLQNFCIECKINYGKQKEHQKLIGDKINSVNRSYFIVRKKIHAKTRDVEYRVEQNEFVFCTSKIDDIFKFFKDPTEHYSQCIMMDSMLHSKKRKLNKVIY